MVYIARIYNNFTISFALKNNLTPCDVSKEIPPTLDFLWDDIHFNIKGAKEAGEIIYKCIIKALNPPDLIDLSYSS